MAEYPLRSSDIDMTRAVAQTRVVYPTREGLLVGPTDAGETTVDVHGRTPRRGALALITGFLLVVIGASVIGLAPETWRALINDAVSLVGAGASYVTWQPINDIGRVPLNPDAFVFGERAQTLLGAAAVVGGGSVLGAGFFPALLSSALIGLIAGCLMILTGVKMTPAVLIVLALGVGYALHAPAGARPLRARGVVGTLLVLAAALCARSGWIRWDWLATRIGGDAPDFFLAWGDLCAWGVVLAAIAVGVGLARQRRLRFLNALVLVAVAWSCIQAGMVKTVHFPTLGVAGKSIDVVDIANVPIWRWVIAGELVLLIWVMLYQTRGFGMMTFAFALTWLVGGIALSNQMATLSFAKSLSSFGATFGSASPGLRSPGTGAPTPGFDNYGVPNSIPPAPAATQIDSAPLATGPIPTPTPEDLRIAREAAIRSTASNAALNAERQKINTEELGVSETTIVSWTFLMALLAGLIAAAGMAWMSRDPIYRRTALAGLWVATIVLAMWLWSHNPITGGQNWKGWLIDWGFQRSLKAQATVFIAVLSCALSGVFALSRGSRASTWRGVSIAAILIGTLASLGAVAILIHSGGFSPLPTWTYAAIAVGQSWLAWVLLLATSREPLPPLNRAVPATHLR